MATNGASAAREGGPKAKIFISYSRKDMRFVDRLDAELRARGFEPLIDRAEIYAFEDWWKRIEDLLTKADTIVFVLSPDAVASDICAKEVSFAASLNKRFAPIVCRRVDDREVPPELRRLNFIFCNDEAQFDDSMAQLSEALTTDIDWMRRHTDFGEQARRWAIAGRPGPRGLLLRSPVLEEAESWIASRPANAPAPTEATQAYIAESRRAATQRRNIFSTSLAAGLVLAVGLAGLAYWQRDIAVEQRRIAEGQRGIAVKNEQRAIAGENLARQNELQAKAERDQALRNQSLFLADLARQQRERDTTTALLLALEAVPDVTAGIDRPNVLQAEFQLDGAYRALRERLVFRGHESDVNSAAFSYDGKRIVTASGDGTARIWNSETGQLIGEPLKGHRGPVYNIAFSPNSRLIVTASQDQTAVLWDALTGKPIATLKGHNGAVISAAFSPDGKRVVTASGSKDFRSDECTDCTARLWDSESGEPIGSPLTGHSDWVVSATFSPDGKRILTASWDRTARLWDAETGKAIRLFEGHAKELASALFSPDGKRIVTASSDMTARLWDVETGIQIGEPLSHEKAVRSAAFNLDGTRIVTASGDGTARIWDAASGKQIGEPLRGHESIVHAAAFSPDGKRVVTASQDTTARLWNAEIGQPAAILLSGHADRLNSAAFSPDGKRIVTASSDKTARLWDAETGTQIGEPLSGHEDAVLSAAFNRDGTRIVTASFDKTARVWDAVSGREIMILNGHEREVWSAVFSPDGKTIATASADATVRIWDAETGKPIGKTFKVRMSMLPVGMRSVAFSPDGARLVTASTDGTVRVWAAADGVEIAVFDHRSAFTSVAFSPDGKTIVTASWGSDNAVWFLDAETAKQIGILHAPHGVPVQSVTFSSDGKRFVTASLDKTFRLWDAATRQPSSEPFRGHQDAVWSAAFSPDDKRIVTASLDKTARIWEISTQALVDAAKRKVSRCLTATQRNTYFLPLEPPAWCVEMEKWPYHTQDWKDWLKFSRQKLNPPLPSDTEKWQAFLTAQQPTSAAPMPTVNSK